jgi:hypothetical protein
MRDITLPKTTADDRGREPELSRRRRLLVLAICCVSIAMVVMDISIVNVALPAIRRDLHASESGLQWTVDAYTLVLASFLVLAGSTARPGGPPPRLPGRPGRHRARLAAVRPGAGHRRPDGGACAAGGRRHDAQPGGDGDHRQHPFPTRPNGPG